MANYYREDTGGLLQMNSDIQPVLGTQNFVQTHGINGAYTIHVDGEAKFTRQTRTRRNDNMYIGARDGAGKTASTATSARPSTTTTKFQTSTERP